MDAPEELQWAVAEALFDASDDLRPEDNWPDDDAKYGRAAAAVLAVPVVRDALAVAATHEAEILRLIDERDEAQEWADRLAAVAGGPDVIGEHSNANNPWANALELLQGEQG